ncbi:hypothetical protein ACFX1R_023153 [Malus domestica]
MTVDADSFLSATVGMVDARLPKNKGKGKAEFVLVQHVLKKNSQPRFKINLFSNEPPTEFSRPAIVESMIDFSTRESDGPIVLCNNYRARVVLTEPKEKPPQTQTLTSRQSSTAVATPPKELSESQRQKVFDRLDP